MQQAGINIVAKWDAKGVDEGIKALNDKLASLKIPKINLTSGGGGGAASGLKNVETEGKKTISTLDQLRITVKNLENAAISSALENGKNAQSTVQLRNAYTGFRKTLDETVKTVKNSRDAYGRLSDITNRATRHAQNLGVIYGTTSEQFKNASDRANALTQRLKDIDAATGRSFRNVGNYAGSFNAIGTNMARIVGEMPNFAQSMKIGFMAISNNIQPLAESIQELKRKNAELAASGKPTTSVLKTLGSALFSWNTLLLVGVTALTAYGPKLIEWIRGTNEAAEATKRAAERQKEYDQIRDQSFSTAGRQISVVKSLQYVLESENTTLKQKEGALKKLQDIYPSYFSNLNLDAVKNGKIAEVIQKELIPAILAAAKARALSDTIAQNTVKDLKLQQEQTKAASNYSKALEEVNKQREAVRTTGDQVGGATGMATGSTRESGKLAGLVETLEKTAKAYRDVRKSRTELANDNKIFNDQLIVEEANLGKLSITGEDTAKFLGKNKKATSDAAKAAEDYRNALAALDAQIKDNLITPSDAASERVKILTDYYKKLTGELKQPITSPLVRQIVTDLAKAQEELSKFNAEARRLDPDLWKRTSESMGDMLEKWREPLEENKIRKLEKAIQIDPGKLLKDIKVPESLKTYLDSVDKLVSDASKRTKESAKKLQDSLVDLGTGIGEAIGGGIGEAISGGGFKFVDVLNEMLHLIGQFVVNYGKELIKVGALLVSAGSLLSEFGGAVLVKKGLTNIAVGGLMVVGGSLLKSVNIGKDRRAFANGGLVYGPTNALVGEYPGASNNPEVIAPLNKLEQIINKGGSQVVVLESRISGQDILLSQQRTQRYNNR